MADPLMIDVEHLSKRYRLNARRARRQPARGPAEAAPRAGAARAESRSFYALRDVSFTVAAGEVVAIVGRNGAGKSTLLKILSRITWPTDGRVALYGRAGSLLEIGAGFHGELTGRENVFLSASVLGASRAETRRRFDDIVQFSGIDRFIDMPVKFYSNGMYLRLAFAIASSIEPDILFIDEALGVGDAEFQRRCRDRIREIGRSGRTVLFVSHNMQIVPQLTGRALWFDAGTLRFDGDAHRAVADYLSSGQGAGPERQWDEATAPGDDRVRLRSVRIVDEDGRPIAVCDLIRPFGVEVVFEVLAPGHVVVPRLEFCNAEGACLFWAFESAPDADAAARTPGRYRTTAWLPGHLFTDGPLSVGVAVQSFRPWMKHADEQNVVTVMMSEPEPGAAVLTARGGYPGYIPGFVRPLLRWTSESG